MAMTKERLEEAAKAAYTMMIARTVSTIAEELEHCWDNQSDSCKSDWIAAIEATGLIAEVERLQAEASRLELENLELDLQVTWDHGSPSEIDKAQAAVDRWRSQRSS